MLVISAQVLGVLVATTMFLAASAAAFFAAAAAFLAAFAAAFLACLAFFAAFGIIFSAGYILWLYNRICFGVYNYKVIYDLKFSQSLIFFFFLLLILIFGIYPNILISVYELSTNKLIIN